LTVKEVDSILPSHGHLAHTARPPRNVRLTSGHVGHGLQVDLELWSFPWLTQGLYQLYTTQFSTVLELKLQQMGSKLRGKLREGFHVGKMASPVNQVGAIQLKAPAGRFSPIQRTQTDYTRRWVFPAGR
jgi:hypothetical protein